MEHNEMLMANVAKVAAYIKENYTDVFPRNWVFEFEHSPYHWAKCAVTKDGYLILGKGNHSSDNCPDTFLLNGVVYQQSPGSMGRSYNLDSESGENFFKARSICRKFSDEVMESFLCKWPTIKASLIMEKEKIESLNNFEV